MGPGPRRQKVSRAGMSVPREAQNLRQNLVPEVSRSKHEGVELNSPKFKSVRKKILSGVAHG